MGQWMAPCPARSTAHRVGELLLCLPRLGCTCRACSSQDRHHPISMGCKTQTVLGGGREQGTEGELCLSTCSAFLGRNLTFLLLLDQGVLLPLGHRQQRLGGHIRGEPQPCPALILHSQQVCVAVSTSLTMDFIPEDHRSFFIPYAL